MKCLPRRRKRPRPFARNTRTTSSASATEHWSSERSFTATSFQRNNFDFAGNEMPAFGRPPEAQPPDPVATTPACGWTGSCSTPTGYKDKAIQQCYEAGYVATNPGNVSLPDQADYYVRHVLHALAWEIPYIRYGMISDVATVILQQLGSDRLLPSLPRGESTSLPMWRWQRGAWSWMGQVCPDGSHGQPSAQVLEFNKPDARALLGVLDIARPESGRSAGRAGCELCLTVFVSVDDQGSSKTSTARLRNCA